VSKCVGGQCGMKGSTPAYADFSYLSSKEPPGSQPPLHHALRRVHVTSCCCLCKKTTQLRLLHGIKQTLKWCTLLDLMKGAANSLDNNKKIATLKNTGSLNKIQQSCAQITTSYMPAILSKTPLGVCKCAPTCVAGLPNLCVISVPLQYFSS